MVGVKPQVVYFSAEEEMVDLVTLTLSERFEVTEVTEVAGLDGALNALRRIKPDYIIVDPDFPHVDHQQFYQRIKADAELKGIQVLIVREDT